MTTEDDDQGTTKGFIPSPRRKGDTEVVLDDTVPSLRDGQLEGLSQFIIDPTPGSGAPIPDPPLPMAGNELRGVVLADRYLLDFEIGRGGMGAVWVAEHLTLRTPVAVKIMLERVAKNSDYVRRFRREARVMSSLRHRHVVQVIDYGVEQGRPFIVMEYLRGKNLADWQDHLERLPTAEELVQIILPLCDAFEAAHGAGVVHRDLKPENIFLTEEGDGREVLKVLDFGLAHMADDGGEGTLTKESLVSGTPPYMSPEQCRSLASVGPATDLYAIGCVLTELLQGAPPFFGDSHADIITQQMFSAPPPLQRPEVTWPVPPLLERLRLDLLAKRPELRPANVSELRGRLLEALDPAREAARLPPRKSADPLGGRSDRIPDWTAPDAHVTSPPTGKLSGKVALLRLQQTPDGLDNAAMVGLSTSGLQLQLLALDERAANATLIVLDAGARVEAACAWLSSNPAASERTIVCVEETRGPVLKRLIAAGAAEILPYPVEVGALLKMARRLLRRQRRRT